MNKLFFLTLILISFPLFAQDDDVIVIQDTNVPVTQDTDVPVAQDDEVIDIQDAKVPVVQDTKAPVVQDTTAPAVQDVDVPAGTPALVYKAPDLRNFDPRESHWLTSFGFEGLKYPVPFDFTGARQTFSPKDQELWGGRFGYGKEFYIGKGFNAVTKVEGYYLGTLFAKRETADPNIEDVDVSYTKTTGQIWGFDVSQSIGYMFDMKTKNPMLEEWSYLTAEPFIEAGIGWATAYNRVDYNYDSGTIQETYKEAVEDQLLNARFGAGINFTSSEGVFLYLKASLNQYDITKRKTKGLGQPDNQGTTGLDGSEKNVDIDPVIIYALGGGYKF